MNIQTKGEEAKKLLTAVVADLERESLSYDELKQAIQQELDKMDGLTAYPDLPEVEAIAKSGKFLLRQTNRGGTVFLHWNDRTVTIL